jgi:hypothetical protein
MPTPNSGESRGHYISRCIPIVINEGTTKDSKQAAAICYSLWKKHHSKSKGQIIIEALANEMLKENENGQNNNNGENT